MNKLVPANSLLHTIQSIFYPAWPAVGTDKPGRDRTSPEEPARKHVHSHQDGSLHEIHSGSYDGESRGHDGGEGLFRNLSVVTM